MNLALINATHRTNKGGRKRDKATTIKWLNEELEIKKSLYNNSAP